MKRSMNTLTLAAMLSLAVIVVLVASAVPAAWGQPEGEDPTAWQGTVDASVNDLFTQTAAAPRNAAMTQAVGTAFVAAQSATVQAAAAAAVAATVTPEPPTATLAPTTAAEPTARPAAFPTDTIADVPVAYQEFERGYMYWLRPNRQIWVAAIDPNLGTGGTWSCYEDTFQEGEQETDPNLIPPEGLYQPRRGFGKLWRGIAEIKDALGWATTPEQELTSQYRYIPGGYVDENGVYFTGAGEHRLLTMRGDVVAFTEQGIVGDCVGGTWQLIPLGQAN